MAIHYIQRYDLSKYTLKSFASANEICCDTNSSDLLTYDANGTTKVVVDTSSTQTLAGKTLTTPVLGAATVTSLATADGVVKLQPVSGSKVWVSGSAYSAFTVTIPTLTAAAGSVEWTLVAINATDVQCDSFSTQYSAVNKAGTSTAAHTYVSTQEAKSVSTGTLTLTATATDGGAGVVTFKVTPTSSITPTTLLLYFTVYPLLGTVAVL